MWNKKSIHVFPLTLLLFAVSMISISGEKPEVRYQINLSVKTCNVKDSLGDELIVNGQFVATTKNIPKGSVLSNCVEMIPVDSRQTPQTKTISNLGS